MSAPILVVRRSLISWHVALRSLQGSDCDEVVLMAAFEGSSSSALGPRVRPCSGFTLVEVLVSAVVIVVAASGAIVAFNLITQSVRGTGLRADQSRVVDAQVAEVSRLAEIYTSCGTPEGAVPPAPVTPATACSGSVVNVALLNSFYYFPDPANAANVADFYAACRATDPGSHITANFIAAIDGLDQPGGGVTRMPAERNPADVASNYLVQVEWVDPANRVLRRIQIVPLVSAWCP